MADIPIPSHSAAPRATVAVALTYWHRPSIAHQHENDCGQDPPRQARNLPDNEYSTETPEVRTNVEIDWARFIGFEELTDFLHAVALHVTNRGQNDEQLAAGQSINYALTRTLWDNYRISRNDNTDDEDWGELNLTFDGRANFYIDRRDAPARKRPASGNAAGALRAERSDTAAPPASKNYSTNTVIVAGILVLFVLLGIVFGTP